jgi:hypothetical protein
MADELTYSISRQWLEGSIGTDKFSLRAWSGGGRGRTGAGAETDAGSYNVFRKESEEGGKHVHGGPIPPGLYICRHLPKHSTFGECIFLEQTLLSLVHIDPKAHPLSGNFIRLYNRDGFFIHGRGKHGSDGCIVPNNPAERKRLNNAVKAVGGILKVVE